MDRYQRVERPRPESAITENEVRITAQGLIRNYVNYAINLLQERRLREIVLKAMGQAISKTVAIAEILKKRIPGLHQDTCISSVSITDVWEPIEEGLVPLETTRHVSMISISLSTSELNKESPGYQAPEEVQEQQSRPRYTQPRQPRYPQNDYYHDESYGGGRGGMRGRGRGRGYQGGGYRNIQARYDNNPNENRYDNYQGRYDNNNQGRYDNNQGRYDNNQGRYDNNQGRYDNNQGRYDNNQGRYENNQGRYERNQGGRYENYRGGYGGGYGGGYNQRYGGGGGGGYGGPNQDNDGYNANRGRGGGMRGRGNFGYRGGYERGRGGPRGGRGYYRGRGRENINQA